MDKKILHRLRRLEGQLKKLHETIATEKDCTEVIPQFLAVKGALAGAYEEYLKDSLEQCTKKDAAKMQRLITMLVKA